MTLNLDEKKVTLAEKFLTERLDAVSASSNILKEFESEPMEEYFNTMLVEGIHLTEREALQIDLTDYIMADMLYRYNNNGDIALNINGKPNKGKSNTLLYFCLQWCKVTGQPFRLSNIVFNSAEYNLLLKGIKIRDKLPDDIILDEYDLKKGDFLALDEAADVMTAGELSMTIITQTSDIENRMRAMQIARICAGTREIFHGSYYSIWVIEKKPALKQCLGFVLMAESNEPDATKRYMGKVVIPYVPRDIFDAYNSPKMRSIRGYGRGSSTNRIAKLVRCLALELSQDPEYLALPAKPHSIRANYIRTKEKYTLFPTNSYINNLRELADGYISRNVIPNVTQTKQITTLRKGLP